MRTIAYNISVKTRKEMLIMAKTANLYARIEPDVKEKAEMILDALGIPASNAINMFYKQIILHKGIPFEVKLPSGPAIPDVNDLSEDELEAMLLQAHEEIERGDTVPFEEAFAQLRREYGL